MGADDALPDEGADDGVVHGEGFEPACGQAVDAGVAHVGHAGGVRQDEDHGQGGAHAAGLGHLGAFLTHVMVELAHGVAQGGGEFLRSGLLGQAAEVVPKQ